VREEEEAEAEEGGVRGRVFVWAIPEALACRLLVPLLVVCVCRAAMVERRGG